MESVFQPRVALLFEVFQLLRWKCAVFIEFYIPKARLHKANTKPLKIYNIAKLHLYLNCIRDQIGYEFRLTMLFISFHDRMSRKSVVNGILCYNWIFCLLAHVSLLVGERGRNELVDTVLKWLPSSVWKTGNRIRYQNNNLNFEFSTYIF